MEDPKKNISDPHSTTLILSLLGCGLGDSYLDIGGSKSFLLDGALLQLESSS
jgi:hypothetical protein